MTKKKIARTPKSRKRPAKTRAEQPVPPSGKGTPGQKNAEPPLPGGESRLAADGKRYAVDPAHPLRFREGPLPDGLVEKAAARAGIAEPEPEVPPSATRPRYLEPREALQRLAAVEREALMSKVDDSLAEKLRELTSCGLYVNEDDDQTREGAILRWTAATLRAVGIAASREEAPEDPTELRFNGEDTAIVLAGVITMLESGFEVSNDLRDAEQSAGGAS